MLLIIFAYLFSCIIVKNTIQYIESSGNLNTAVACPIDLILDDGFKKKTKHMLSRAVLEGTPPPQDFRRYLKNGDAKRRHRFWHTLSYIFSA